MDFLNCLVKLEPQEVLGLAHILGVQIYEEGSSSSSSSNTTLTQKSDAEVRASEFLKDLDKKPRDGVAILTDILTVYESLNRKTRRNIYKTVHKATKR